MTVESKDRIFTDNPLTDPGEDQLGRAGFASQLARTLLAVGKGRSLVVGLYGSWGSGKSSVLNMVALELGRHHEPTVVVIKFNPWYFADEPSLIEQFFEALAEGIGTSEKGRANEIASALRKYGKFLQPLGILAGIVAKAMVPAGDLALKVGAGALEGAAQATGAVASEAANAFASETTIRATRTRISELLGKSDQRVIVLIDDIDRLEPDAVRTVFKLVRLVGDLPNVSYLLAFDPDVVARCLGSSAGVDADALRLGHAFIEKIVQVALHLPPARPDLLRRLALELIIEAVTSNSEKFDQKDIIRLVTAWDRSIGSRFRTLREVKRLLNSVRFALPLLQEEVDPVDVVLIECLRMLEPEVFAAVRNAPQVVLAIAEHGPQGPKSPLQIALEAAAEGNPGRRAQVEALLRELFPRFSGGHGAEWDPIWRRQKRVASEEHLAKALHYGVPEGVVSDCKYQEVLHVLRRDSPDIEAFDAALTALADTAGWTDIIWRLRGEVKSLTGAQARLLAVTLPRHGASFSHVDGVHGVLPTIMNAALLVVSALERCPDPASELAAVFDVCGDAAFAANILSVLYELSKQEDEDQPLRQRLLEAGKAAFANLAGRLLQGPDWIPGARKEVLRVLTWWRDSVGTESVQKLLDEWLIEEPEWAYYLLAAVFPADDAFEAAKLLGGNYYSSLTSVVPAESLVRVLRGKDDLPISQEQFDSTAEMGERERLRVVFLYLHQVEELRGQAETS